MVVNEEILINAELEKVYKIAETYPLFVSFYKEKKISSNRNNKIFLSICSSIFGIPFRWEGEGTKGPYNLIEYKQTKGLLKGMSSVWYFTKIDNRTKVKIKNEIKIRLFFFGGLVEWIIGIFIIKHMLKKILFSLKEIAEK